MRRLELSIPLSLLEDLGILSKRFFRHNRSIAVLQSFSIRPDVAALIVRVRRRGPFKEVAAVLREARAIARRYRVERFEILSADATRGEYIAWLEWRPPSVLQGPGRKRWGGIVPIEVALSRPNEARAVLLASEEDLPRMRELLDALGAPYRVRAVRTAAADAWQPLAALTPRQRQLLELAFRLGYYASPAKSTLEAIGGRLGISKAAASKHLRAAERKILAATLGAG